MTDKVNHPDHYTQGGIECIDAIKAALGQAFADYCVGNVIKYVWRWRYKGEVEDLRKAQVYLGWAAENGSIESVAPNSSETPTDSLGDGYRVPTESDVGKMIEVRDYNAQPWYRETLSEMVRKDTREYQYGYRVVCHDTRWAQARIKIGGDA